MNAHASLVRFETKLALTPIASAMSEEAGQSRIAVGVAVGVTEIVGTGVIVGITVGEGVSVVVTVGVGGQGQQGKRILRSVVANISTQIASPILPNINKYLN